MKLPKKVYVYVENEGTNEEWLSAEKTAEGHATKGEKRLVGVYELKEKISVTLKVTEEIVQEKA